MRIRTLGVVAHFDSVSVRRTSAIVGKTIGRSAQGSASPAGAARGFEGVLVDLKEKRIWREARRGFQEHLLRFWLADQIG